MNKKLNCFGFIMVFWCGKESTQGSLILLLSCTPSLSLLLCIATTLTKKIIYFASIASVVRQMFSKCRQQGEVSCITGLKKYFAMQNSARTVLYGRFNLLLLLFLWLSKASSFHRNRVKIEIGSINYRCCSWFMDKNEPKIVN